MYIVIEVIIFHSCLIWMEELLSFLIKVHINTNVENVNCIWALPALIM